MRVNIEKFKSAVYNSGLTVLELSKLSNVSRTTINRINSDIEVKPSTLGKIAKVLEMRIEDFI